ncbi:50S ribosomal protein L32 [Syntrophorhabdus aromaticivorans]|uniref:Large ribosomal subunit protein bL32 n=1 Tax=Syntrophorhabdus aromaticivorans TaxID=328301 RepID=A0A351U7R2_9BACT|nr:50S ribosomal protein L32 [Syntrophorhabdus aromaticivorans]NLW35360.1 50S ribosomal protein L32 [Syntrophorhabdus aromaticivorans]HBA55993.1 50S ribosomal protein L32 [Syntrophorhabdus aromaticivorans]
MAVPKRKTSKSARDKRRTHYKATAPSIVLCPNCKEPKLPHIVCSKCGFYRGRQYLEVGEA